MVKMRVKLDLYKLFWRLVDLKLSHIDVYRLQQLLPVSRRTAMRILREMEKRKLVLRAGPESYALNPILIVKVMSHA